MNVNKTMSSKTKKKTKKKDLRILENHLNKFVDFNKKNGAFYDNLYINEFKCVIKSPFTDSRKAGSKNNIKIEKFDLTNSIYIVNYD
jgi:hypothetical protein